MKCKSIGLATGLLVVLLGALMTGAARAPAAHASTTPTVYTDAVGDALGSAADIQAVSISDVDGVVTLTVTAPGLQLGPLDTWAELAVGINVDQSTATGDPLLRFGPTEGADYSLIAGIGSDGAFGAFAYYDTRNAEWKWVPPASTLTYAENGGEYTFTFPKADLGIGSAFDFAVSAQTSDTGYGDTTGDWISYEVTSSAPSQPAPEPRPIMELPDGTMYLLADGEYHPISAAQFGTFGLSSQAIAYVGQLYEPVGAPATDEQVQAMEAAYVKALNDIGVSAAVPAVKPPVTAPAPATVVESPVINAPLTFPAQPRAGKYFTVSFPVTSSATGRMLESATMICDPQVKGKVLPHDEGFNNGKATLRFVIPATAKGKLLKVHLTMVLGNQSTTRVETFTVH
jgi:hypothetical protein